jgi:16S rRNA (guanine527-N7)-methyltransferase
LTEDEAQEWLVARLNVPRETLKQLQAYIDLVVAEQANQNLVSAATIPNFWARHIVDSAQLLQYFEKEGSVLDVGSGAGLPGIVLAIITGMPVTLVEPRPLRAAFLTRVANELQLRNIEVMSSSLAHVPVRKYTVVTARAVAALPKLVAMTIPFTDLSTVWVLPKGKSGRDELESLPTTWQGRWTAQPSVTDPESLILVGRGIRMRGKA